jgi:hypothetical protein
MKGMLYLVAAGFLMFSATGGFATTTTNTSMDNWTCTTNASSSSVASEQAADKEMQEKPKSAADAFAFASQNCRDCTKITCETNSNNN